MLKSKKMNEDIHAAVIVETRPLMNVARVIRLHMKMLDNKWKLFIFHGNRNAHLFKEFDNAVKINLGGRISTKHAYSALLCSKHFWNQIPHEKILIFQHDSLLLRKGIEDFLSWDWIGAPSWWGGFNGGLSLRSNSKMVEIIDRFRYAGQSEDMYFNQYAKQVGRVPPKSIARDFACEAWFRLGTLGYHGLYSLSGSEKHLVKMQYAKQLLVP